MCVCSYVRVCVNVCECVCVFECIIMALGKFLELFNFSPQLSTIFRRVNLRAFFAHYVKKGFLDKNYPFIGYSYKNNVRLLLTF